MFQERKIRRGVFENDLTNLRMNIFFIFFYPPVITRVAYTCAKPIRFAKKWRLRRQVRRRMLV